MQRLSLRSSVARAAVAPARPAPQRRIVRASAVDANTPANVVEAKEWVNKWRAKQQAAEGGAAPEHAQQAAAEHVEEPAAPSGPKLQPCKSFSDGTLLFTSDSLKKVDFDQIKL